MKEPMDYYESKKRFDALDKSMYDLKVLFLAINRKMNAVEELYQLFSGRSVGEMSRSDT